MNTVIYNFKTHSLYYDDDADIFKNTISFAIDTVEIFIDKERKTLQYISGYLPLLTAERKEISVDYFIEKSFLINLDLSFFEPAITYDFFEYFPESELYFKDNSHVMLSYDAINHYILIGMYENEEKLIKVKNNIFLSLDENEILKAILIKVDVVEQ